MEGMKRDELGMVIQGCACLGTWYLRAHLVCVGRLRIAKAARKCSSLGRKNTGCIGFLVTLVRLSESHAGPGLGSRVFMKGGEHSSSQKL